jgi:hypothetical protein
MADGVVRYRAANPALVTRALETTDDDFKNYTRRLEPGDVVVALQPPVVSGRGQRRVLLEDGWASLESINGRTLLEPLERPGGGVVLPPPVVGEAEEETAGSPTSELSELDQIPAAFGHALAAAPAPAPPEGVTEVATVAGDLVELPENERHERQVRAAQDARARIRLKAGDRRRASLLAAFARADANGDGVCTRAELIKALRTDAELRAALRLPARVREADRAAFEQVFQEMDRDDGRAITAEEFVAYVLASSLTAPVSPQPPVITPSPRLTDSSAGESPPGDGGGGGGASTRSSASSLDARASAFLQQSATLATVGNDEDKGDPQPSEAEELDIRQTLMLFYAETQVCVVGRGRFSHAFSEYTRTRVCAFALPRWLCTCI